MYVYKGRWSTNVHTEVVRTWTERTLRRFTVARTLCPVIDDDGLSALLCSGVTHTHTHTFPFPNWMNLVRSRPTQLLPAWITAHPCVFHLITESVLMNLLSFSFLTHRVEYLSFTGWAASFSADSCASIDLIDGLCFTPLMHSSAGFSKAREYHSALPLAEDWKTENKHSTYSNVFVIYPRVEQTKSDQKQAVHNKTDTGETLAINLNINELFYEWEDGIYHQTA